MAIAILRNHTKVVHGPEHDLESLFYIFLWICINYAGPHGEVRKDFPSKQEIPVLKWIDPEKSFRDIAEAKLGQCSYPSVFRTDILSFFHGYFEDLKECSKQLRTLFFTDLEKRVTHDEVLAIFQDTLKKLSEEHPNTPTDKHLVLPLPSSPHQTQSSLEAMYKDVDKPEDEQGDEDKPDDDQPEDEEEIEDDDEPEDDVEEPKAEEHGQHQSDEISFRWNVSDEDGGDYPIYDDSAVLGDPSESALPYLSGIPDDLNLKRKRDDVFSQVASEKIKGQRRRLRRLSDSTQFLDISSIASLPASMEGFSSMPN